jgi:hypothetical protein
VGLLLSFFAKNTLQCRCSPIYRAVAVIIYESCIRTATYRLSRQVGLDLTLGRQEQINVTAH